MDTDMLYNDHTQATQQARNNKIIKKKCKHFSASFLGDTFSTRQYKIIM